VHVLSLAAGAPRGNLGVHRGKLALPRDNLGVPRNHGVCPSHLTAASIRPIPSRLDLIGLALIAGAKGKGEEEPGGVRSSKMLQLLMAVAFSAAPLTLYVPPVRSLNLFVEAMEVVCRDCGPYSHGAVARFRVDLSRVLAGLA
jgi:hypothetical protein